MIPKKIHYCWFGGNEMPEVVIKCIKSWKEIMPDYEIIKWETILYLGIYTRVYIPQANNIETLKTIF